jgi:CheY-like chemotaxis protein
VGGNFDGCGSCDARFFVLWLVQTSSMSRSIASLLLQLYVGGTGKIAIFPVDYSERSAMLHTLTLRRRILVIDDEPLFGKMISQFLAKRGYDVAVAANGLARLILAEQFQPDVIILDMRMPVMDGEAFLEMYVSHAPVIAMSASWGLRRPNLLPGMASFLPKPFELQELLNHIHRVLPDAPSLSKIFIKPEGE